MIFGEYIREKRKHRMLTLKKFSNLCGVSAAYISSIESGKRGAPSEKVLDKMTRALNLNEDEKSEFYNLAGSGSRKNGVPADLAEYVSENPLIWSLLRKLRDNPAASRELKKLLDSI